VQSETNETSAIHQMSEKRPIAHHNQSRIICITEKNVVLMCVYPCKATVLQVKFEKDGLAEEVGHVHVECLH
jgi:hypothetical protein